MWDEHYNAPYMHKGLKWVSYDDANSIAAKSRFATERGAAGIMVWSIDTDDFRGSCDLPQGRFPLLKTINRVLYEHENGFGSGGSAASTSYHVLAAAIILMLQMML